MKPEEFKMEYISDLLSTFKQVANMAAEAKKCSVSDLSAPLPKLIIPPTMNGSFRQPGTPSTPSSQDRDLCHVVQDVIKCVIGEGYQDVVSSMWDGTKDYLRSSIDTIKIKDYEPLKFHEFRQAAIPGGSRALLDAICDHDLTLVESPGNSGALFFFSQDRDNSFVIKTMEHHESVTFRTWIMKNYFVHMEKYQMSLLPRIYCHCKFTYKGYEKYIFVMNNLFAGYGDKIEQTYDIKGSLVGRVATERERQAKQFKDQDITEMQRVFNIGATLRPILLEQLEKDVEFLHNCNIMDYSLLVGVTTDHTMINYQKKQDHSVREGMSFVLQVENNEAYSFGIIDIMQHWNFKKIAAMLIKSAVNERADISTVPPEEYRERFLRFTSNLIT
jgi:hypothetical protein